jgi:hypothetical protein
VQRDLVREFRPRKLLDLQHVAQELGQVVDVGGDVSALGGVADRGELVTQVVHAAVRWGDDVVVAGEVADEQLLGGLGFLVGAAVRHRLAAARLVEGVVDPDAELLQQLQGRHPDLGIEHIDVAGDHQSYAHRSNPFQ